MEQARWWERHLLEVITGRVVLSGDEVVPSGSDEQDRGPRWEHDPARRTLRQRELAKVAELAAAGHQVRLRTLQRLRRAYEVEGLWGLVDGRVRRSTEPSGQIDPRIVAAVEAAVAAETDRSTGTVSRLRRRVEAVLAAEYGEQAPPLPSRATFYRLVERVAAGRHTFGSARTRRSLAKQPDGPFGTLRAARPGELVQIDSTPLDVRVVLDNGVIDRVELTAMVDLATRTIAAAVLRPTTKAVDAALLLARAVTPEPMRPGWPEALAMSRSVLPHQAMLSVDERIAHAAARPPIVPETIVCDHGKAFLSQAFRSACRALGVTFQPAHPDTPTDKPVVERTLGSVATLFAQHVRGYVGPNVERRGAKAEQDAVWPIAALQELLDEWIVACWQNRPHDGLRDPVTPGAALSPNEKYAALVQTSGYVPVALSPEDYIELLPVTWRAINSYGVKINHRVYDSADLNPHRRQHSGITARGGLWEVHYDPYDITRIWIRNHHRRDDQSRDHSSHDYASPDHQEDGADGDGVAGDDPDRQWISAVWTHLRTAPMPFGEQAWQHARAVLARRGQDPATEQEIAQAVRDLLERAEHGPTAAESVTTAVAAPDTATDARPPGEQPGRRTKRGDRARQGRAGDRAGDRADRRVAGRARATSASAWPRPDEPQGPLTLLNSQLGNHFDSHIDSQVDEGPDADVAPVIPLPVFDAREEAERWR